MSIKGQVPFFDDGDTAVQVADPQLKEPSMYQVVLLNDDFTPMDFVVELLQLFFFHSTEKATKIMLEIHNAGKGVCGIYTEDVAATKTTMVNQYAQDNEHPLRCEFEPYENGE
jgi:ATP-dependent Clp protease adaptor protein ClpS